MKLSGVHHIAIICSDFFKSKDFYVNKLGFEIINETFRESRNSYKLDLALNNNYLIELFSFSQPPARTNQPEACGLRHLAFSVTDINEAIQHLSTRGVITEPVRMDELTGKLFTFFCDPDGLPLELYEV